MSLIFEIQFYKKIRVSHIFRRQGKFMKIYLGRMGRQSVKSKDLTLLTEICVLSKQWRKKLCIIVYIYGNLW